jgi:hypothetical protein
VLCCANAAARCYINGGEKDWKVQRGKQDRI